MCERARVDNRLLGPLRRTAADTVEEGTLQYRLLEAIHLYKYNKACVAVVSGAAPPLSHRAPDLPRRPAHARAAGSARLHHLSQR